jgi:hypothetical protein
MSSEKGKEPSDRSQVAVLEQPRRFFVDDREVTACLNVCLFVYREPWPMLGSER